MSFYPHLINAVEVVVLYVIKIYQFYYLKVITFSGTSVNPLAITQLIIQSVVYVYHILTSIVSTVVVYYIVYDILTYVWVYTLQCLAENFWQYAFLHTATTSNANVVLFLYAWITFYASPTVFWLR